MEHLYLHQWNAAYRGENAFVRPVIGHVPSLHCELERQRAKLTDRPSPVRNNRHNKHPEGRCWNCPAGDNCCFPWLLRNEHAGRAGHRWCRRARNCRRQRCYHRSSRRIGSRFRCNSRLVRLRSQYTGDRSIFRKSWLWSYRRECQLAEYFVSRKPGRRIGSSTAFRRTGAGCFDGNNGGMVDSGSRRNCNHVCRQCRTDWLAYLRWNSCFEFDIRGAVCRS